MKTNELATLRAKRRFIWHYTNNKGCPIEKSPIVKDWMDGADGATMRGFKYISNKDRRALCHVLLSRSSWARQAVEARGFEVLDDKLMNQFQPEMTITFTDDEGDRGILFLDYELVEYPNGFKRNEFTFVRIHWL